MTDKIYTDKQTWYWQTSLLSTPKVDTDRQGLNWQTRFTLSRLILAGHTNIFKQYYVNSAVRQYLCIDMKQKKWRFT